MTLFPYTTLFRSRTSGMPLIDKVEKRWTVYKENRPKTIQPKHTTPAPRPRTHTSRRPSRPSDQSQHSNTSTQHGGGKNSEPPLRLPRRPQGRAPPSRWRKTGQQVVPRPPPPTTTALHWSLRLAEHPKARPQEANDAGAPPRPIPHGIWGFPRRIPSGGARAPPRRRLQEGRGAEGRRHLRSRAASGTGLSQIGRAHV